MQFIVLKKIKKKNYLSGETLQGLTNVCLFLTLLLWMSIKYNIIDIIY